jgi:hypothetical protein
MSHKEPCGVPQSKLRRFTGLALSALAACTLIACGGGGSSSGVSSTVDIGGSSSKGLLKGAEVKAYRVINGRISSTVLASAITDANGEYKLKVPNSSDPIVIEVRMVTGTKMLDETKIQLDGSFEEVDAPAGLTMRSFATSATEAQDVHVNPLTEAAVAIAAQTASGASLTADTLRIAKQAVIDELAPAGANPFTAKPPKSLADATDDQKKLAVFMAGLMKTASNNDIAAAIKELSSGIALTKGTDGKFLLPAPSRQALYDMRGRKLDEGKKLPHMTGIDITPPPRPTEDKTVNPSDIAAKEGFYGFVQSLRTGLQATNTATQAVDEDLSKQYVNATSRAVEYMYAAIDVAISQCLASNLAVGANCKRSYPSSPPQFQQGAYQLYKFPNRTGSIDIYRNSDTQFTITASGNKLTYVNGQSTSTKDTSVTLTATQKAISDTANQYTLAGTSEVSQFVPNQPNIKGTLEFKDIVIGTTVNKSQNPGDKSNDEAIVTFNGAIQLTITDANGQARDGLLGTISMKSGEGMTLKLAATNKSSPIGSLELKQDADGKTMVFTLGLPKDTSLVLTESLINEDSKNISLVVKNASREVTIKEISTNTWSISTNGNIYSATITLNPAGRYVGNIYRDKTVVGQIVNGILQVDGQEISIY